MSVLLVTATDTEVGKTVVTGILGRILREEGMDIGLYKPLQSGHALMHPEGDVMRLRTVAGVFDLPEVMCCRAIEEPLAPGLALARAGIELSRAELLAHARTYLATHANTIVEGAGGLLAPLLDGFTVCDLACELHARALVVARAGLGTVNHTALTVAHARARGIDVVGVIVSGMPEDEADLAWANLPMIEQYAKCPVVAVLPRLEPLDLARATDMVRRQWNPAIAFA
ncbi:dethiobiotin synthase [Ferroacidibacillus organovorans]|uniref:ATP-dependent dethiobiotin synthetase BioD n=1 Tax=Ferroacidibacillus organovorans TaxID=1765683 RepID=A0A162UTE7_9BACL|nr:dethiobiotin synthase [Ferroacidibacillus organovorans]KYP82028.1 hypothetical protein AYJ22_04820 [Ferroacidibacillus organovorans]OAG94348.1 hypothetical protein AYW79_05640 [Ferroacidibacillus organovorans]OPG15254.1 dethiobiotin synthase [Ferroacidibacillus organovorans]